MKDLNAAFPRTPREIEGAIREGIRRGMRREARRARWLRAAAVAAAAVVLVGAFSILRQRERPDPTIVPSGGNVLAAPSASAEATPRPAPTAAQTALEISTPDPTPLATPTPTPKPTASETTAPDQSPIQTEAPEQAVIEELDTYAYESITAFTGGYSTPKGTYLHTQPYCSNMYGAQWRTVEEALALSQDLCPVCFDFYVTNLTSYVYLSKTDAYYHADRACAGVPLAKDAFATALTTADRARMRGALPCPKCALAQMAGAAADSFALGETLWSTPGGEYFHIDQNCSGMLNASARTLEEALALNQKACPACIDGQKRIYCDTWSEQDGLVTVSFTLEDRPFLYGDGVTAGALIDTSALEKQQDDAQIRALLADGVSAAAQELVQTLGAARIDVYDLDVEAKQPQPVSRTEQTEGGARKIRLVYNAAELANAPLEIELCVRQWYWLLTGEGAFASPAVTARQTLSLY